MVRIEDTDRTRYIPGCEEEIIESLEWIGATWHEGPDKGGPFAPYRQSERKEAGIYDEYWQRLIELGHAYKAFDTPQELEEMREYQQINKQPVGYFGGMWREASAEKVAEAEAEGRPFVVRLRMPRGKALAFQDAIRGRVEFRGDDVDDPVLIKADGMPTYHFAAMVDDHLMGTTHIIRGEEWISSAPKHVWLFQAFGWEPPIFVHVPVINGKDGKKLSKRHGDTRVLDFRASGYTPEALANFIALIGWAPGDNQEILSMEEMAARFDLAGLQPSPGVFDIDKLNWMSGNYLRAMTPQELFERLEAYVRHPETKAYWTHESRAEQGVWPKLERVMAADLDYVLSTVPLAQERMVTLPEFASAVDFCFVEEVEFDPAAREKAFAHAHVPELFAFMIAALEGQTSISHDACEALAKQFAAEKGIEKMGPVVAPIRVALTGRMQGPGLFDLMAVLGPERMRARFARARA